LLEPWHTWLQLIGSQRIDATDGSEDLFLPDIPLPPLKGEEWGEPEEEAPNGGGLVDDNLEVGGEDDHEGDNEDDDGAGGDGGRIPGSSHPLHDWSDDDGGGALAAPGGRWLRWVLRWSRSRLGASQPFRPCVRL
jgi:hypothetical protein